MFLLWLWKPQILRDASRAGICSVYLGRVVMIHLRGLISQHDVSCQKIRVKCLGVFFEVGEIANNESHRNVNFVGNPRRQLPYCHHLFLLQ